MAIARIGKAEQGAQRSELGNPHSEMLAKSVLLCAQTGLELAEICSASISQISNQEMFEIFSFF